MNTNAAFARIQTTLRISANNKSDEPRAAQRFWDDLVEQFRLASIPLTPLLMPLLEQALFWRVMADRFEQALVEQSLQAFDQATALKASRAQNAALAPVIKAHDRLRKILKEIAALVAKANATAERSAKAFKSTPSDTPQPQTPATQSQPSSPPAAHPAKNDAPPRPGPSSSSGHTSTPPESRVRMAKQRALHSLPPKLTREAFLAPILHQCLDELHPRF